jgi:predicted nucleotide-binding protein
VSSGAEGASPVRGEPGANWGYCVDARGALGIQVGQGNAQILHADTREAKAGGVPRPPGDAAGPNPRPSPEASRKVFVVHGRDGALAARFRDLLRTVGLQPLEWESLVRATRSTAPFLGQVVTQAPHLAQATLALLSPDDVVELHSGLTLGNDHPAERARSMQARPNVFFELGLAMKACPGRTIVVEVGGMRPAGDLAGLNVIRFTGSGPSIKKVLDRLAQAGCPVDLSGTDWMDQGRFDGLAAYQRGPNMDASA